MSTRHYKRYNNPLLRHMERSYTGMQSGSISIPHITVADDLVLLAQNRADMQIMVWDAKNGADKEKNCIYPAKKSYLIL